MSDYVSEQYGAVVPSTMCFRRKAFLQLSGYRTSLYPVDDYDLLLRAEEKFKVAVINKPLVKYRIHGSSASFKEFYDMGLKTRYIEALAKLRRAGESEISLDEFMKNTQMSMLSQLDHYRFSTGQLMFRKSGLLFGENMYFMGVLNLLGAWLLAPKFVSERLLSLRKASS